MKTEEYHKHAEFESVHGWFKAKRDLISSILEEYKPDGLLLDVGCGMGINLEKFGGKRKVWGVDISARSIDYCKRYSCKLIQADAGSLPFRTNSFDAITALDLLEHIDYDENAIFEFHRILKKEGILVTSVPAYGFLFSEHDRSLHHRRRYSIHGLQRLMSKQFFIEKIFYWNFIFFPILCTRIILDNLRNYRGESYVRPLPKLINFLVFAVLSFENLLLRYISFPFGLTLMCIARKNK